MQKKADMNKYLHMVYKYYICMIYKYIYIYIMCLYTKQPLFISAGWNPQQKVAFFYLQDGSGQPSHAQAFTTQQLLIKTHVIVPLEGPWVAAKQRLGFLEAMFLRRKKNTCP